MHLERTALWFYLDKKNILSLSWTEGLIFYKLLYILSRSYWKITDLNPVKYCSYII